MEDERRWTYVVDDPWNVSRHLKVEKLQDEWMSPLESPKIRLGRRVENKCHTTLSPIWYSFFTQKFNFNLSLQKPSSYLYSNRGLVIQKENEKAHANAANKSQASKSDFWNYSS